MELAKLGGRRKKLQGEGGAGRPTKHRDGKYLLSVCVCVHACAPSIVQSTSSWYLCLVAGTSLGWRKESMGEAG